MCPQRWHTMVIANDETHLTYHLINYGIAHRCLRLGEVNCVRCAVDNSNRSSGTWRQHRRGGMVHSKFGSTGRTRAWSVSTERIARDGSLGRSRTRYDHSQERFVLVPSGRGGRAVRSSDATNDSPLLPSLYCAGTRTTLQLPEVRRQPDANARGDQRKLDRLSRRSSSVRSRTKRSRVAQTQSR